MMPVVQQTTALLGERPMANAFGTLVSAIASLGFGRSAWMQRRSIIACRPGACSGVTSLAPIAARPILSDRNSCPTSSAPRMTTMMPTPAPAANRTPTNTT